MKEMSKKMKIIALIIALVILVGIIVTFTVGLNFDLRYQEVTEEQKTDIINKINGKYELELTADSTQITNVPHTRGRDIVRPYLAPFAIATGIILAYMAIRYYKLGMVLTLGKTIAMLVIAQATLLSVMAIARIPIGRLTIPLVLATYVLSLVGMTTYFENNLREKKKEEE